MSIHVTVSGNPVNICRGRMVLSDLDQIKKNERDRRRRLRLEQVYYTFDRNLLIYSSSKMQIRYESVICSKFIEIYIIESDFLCNSCSQLCRALDSINISQMM